MQACSIFVMLWFSSALLLWLCMASQLSVGFLTPLMSAFTSWRTPYAPFMTRPQSWRHCKEVSFYCCRQCGWHCMGRLYINGYSGDKIPENGRLKTVNVVRVWVCGWVGRRCMYTAQLISPVSLWLSDICTVLCTVLECVCRCNGYFVCLWDLLGLLPCIIDALYSLKCYPPAYLPPCLPHVGRCYLSPHTVSEVGAICAA